MKENAFSSVRNPRKEMIHGEMARKLEEINHLGSNKRHGEHQKLGVKVPI